MRNHTTQKTYQVWMYNGEENHDSVIDHVRLTSGLSLADAKKLCADENLDATIDYITDIDDEAPDSIHFYIRKKYEPTYKISIFDVYGNCVGGYTLFDSESADKKYESIRAALGKIDPGWLVLRSCSDDNSKRAEFEFHKHVDVPSWLKIKSEETDEESVEESNEESNEESVEESTDNINRWSADVD